MATSTDSLFEFLKIIGDKGHWNSHTVNSRRTACSKLLDILDADDRTIEYVRDNIDVIKARFSNLNKDVSGSTIDAYANRLLLVVSSYQEWTADRTAWEKANSQRQAARINGDGEKKQRATRTKTAAPEIETEDGEEDDVSGGTAVRIIDFPLRPGFDVKIKLPRDVSLAEIVKLARVLALYATDFEPTMSPAELFPKMIRGGDRNLDQDGART